MAEFPELPWVEGFRDRVNADREMAVIEVWVRTLDIYADEKSAKSVEQQLFDEIRQRMYQLYFRRAQVSAHE